MDSFHRGFERLMVYENYLSTELASRDIMSSMICGAIAGIVAKTAVAPAERIKMSFQISTIDKFTFHNAYLRGKTIIATGDKGIFSLWKGHSTTLIRVGPYAGLSYATHDYLEKYFRNNTFHGQKNLPFLYKFLCGSVGGAVGTIFTYPLDVLRVRLALIPNSTWSSCIAQGGLFQGIVPTLMGIIPYAGTSWMVKQTLQELYPTLYIVVHPEQHHHHHHQQHDNSHCNPQPSIFESLIINSLAGLSGQLVTYPLDIVRRRMQMAIYTPSSSSSSSSASGAAALSNVNRNSVIEMVKELVSKEGWRGLTKGFSVNIVKGPITLSLSLTTYDLLRAWINRRKTSNTSSSSSSSSS